MFPAAAVSTELVCWTAKSVKRKPQQVLADNDLVFVLLSEAGVPTCSGSRTESHWLCLPQPADS
jgi:hypothetical protein